MAFGLRFGSAHSPISVKPVRLQIEGPGFTELIDLPPPGVVVNRDYGVAGALFSLAVRFYADNDVVRILVHHLADNDALYIMADQHIQAGSPIGVRFVGTIWHAIPRSSTDPDHCTITCEASGETADCCIVCSDGSTTAKICC